MKPPLYFTSISLILFGVMGLSIAVGSINIPIETVIRILLAKLYFPVLLQDISDTQQVIIWQIRLPRVLVAGLVGAALAVAGVQMQGLFQNPLASPDIIGVSSGGALGAVTAISLGLTTQSLFFLPFFAFIGAFVTLFSVYALASYHGRTPLTTLLLAGVACNTLIGAMMSLLISFAWVEYEVARTIIFWMMGSLDSRLWIHVWLALPSFIIGLSIAMFYRRELDILLMGQETAYALGVEVEQVKRILLTSAALLTGTAVAVSGMIGFIGLVVPHIVRLLIGAKHQQLLPASALTGAVFLISADLLARTIHRPQEIQLGILTAILGAPFFLWLLLHHKRQMA
ncbi:FecCD family ABC transporter permease [Beggiatoa leptomitoformis]|uniref:Iron chelate uptake ABC transporter family permease subunit n=1 Tax=Beggiatoa leptomitoformis TaxID=288004 RepID=A0A2N9YE24_9GAMM|nr:iron chelate uptake ABC transporter family permease subunit [Beggiatoa leptomitoformis]ALG68889.1 iron chelate uptake ABC transporter family permease subunit [Beggiatoa leptomitoformis]AUI68738.1 iron chelate uptake ABC transporter family permease subunit [Beggiatoa leptomitoformis]